MVKLNKVAFAYAKELANEGKLVWDERDAWSEHQPSAQQENAKKKYKFPYGDFEKVHRCAVISAESRAGQYKHHDIELAAAHLHGMIDESKPAARTRRARA